MTTNKARPAGEDLPAIIPKGICFCNTRRFWMVFFNKKKLNKRVGIYFKHFKDALIFRNQFAEDYKFLDFLTPSVLKRQAALLKAGLPFDYQRETEKGSDSEIEILKMHIQILEDRIKELEG